MSDRPDIAALAAVAREVAAEWQVELGEPFALAPLFVCRRGGRRRPCSRCAPEDDEADEEADALELWAGDGAVRLLRRDRMRRALLVERARPGDDIAGLPDDEATAVAVEVGRRLWRPAAAPFRWIGDGSALARQRRGPSARPARARALRLRSTSAVTSSCTATFTTTTSSTRRAGRLRSMRRRCSASPSTTSVVPLESDPDRMDPGVTCPARGSRHSPGWARPGADAEVDGDPGRVPGCGRERDRGATRASLGTASAAPRGAPSSSCGRGGAGCRERS